MSTHVGVVVDQDDFQPWLVVREKVADDWAHRLFPGEHVIGRSRTCEIYLPHETVSRQHARVVVGSDHVMLFDLGSRNGTYCNGNRIEKARMEVGDRLVIGAVAIDLVNGKDELLSSASDDSCATRRRLDDKGIPRNHRVKLVDLLTDAQRRVFDLLVTGKAEKLIAKDLMVSAHTVHNHVRVIYRTFGVRSKAELIARHTGTFVE